MTALLNAISYLIGLALDFPFAVLLVGIGGFCAYLSVWEQQQDSKQD